jgi:hypothetical protein
MPLERIGARAADGLVPIRSEYRPLVSSTPVVAAVVCSPTYTSTSRELFRSRTPQKTLKRESVQEGNRVVGQIASRHPLSTRQTASIRAAMQLFVEDDIASGRPINQRRYCDACERNRPAAGFIQYTRYSICNACATSYELARARGLAISIGQYVRDRRFGEIPEEFAAAD